MDGLEFKTIKIIGNEEVNKVKPLSPYDMYPIPDVVVESVNELIEKNFLPVGFVLFKMDIVRLVNEKLGKDNELSHNSKSFNFLYIFRNLGWKIKSNDSNNRLKQSFTFTFINN